MLLSSAAPNKRSASCGIFAIDGAADKGEVNMCPDALAKIRFRNLLNQVARCRISLARCYQRSASEELVALGTSGSTIGAF